MTVIESLFFDDSTRVNLAEYTSQDIIETIQDPRCSFLRRALVQKLISRDEELVFRVMDSIFKLTNSTFLEISMSKETLKNEYTFSKSMTGVFVALNGLLYFQNPLQTKLCLLCPEEIQKIGKEKIIDAARRTWFTFLHDNPYFFNSLSHWHGHDIKWLQKNMYNRYIRLLSGEFVSYEDFKW